MEAKVLNFPDAMKLAQILGKYIDTESIKDKPLLDFLDDLLNKLHPLDYLETLKLITQKSPKELSELNGNALLSTLYSGLEKNKILSLLDTSKMIGFVYGNR